MAGWGQDQRIRHFADSLAEAYLLNPQAIDVNLINTVLVRSSREGDLERFKDYQSRFETANSSQERRYFLNALGYFKDDALQDLALEYILTGPLRSNELTIISGGIRNTDAGKDKVMRWIMENYSDLTSRMPTHSAITILGYGANGNISGRISRARDFIHKTKDIIPGTEGYLAKIEEEVLDRERLRIQVIRSIEKYLSDQGQ